MRTLVKISAVIAAAIVLFIVALAVLAKIFITPERVRDTVLPIAEKALSRTVQLDDISISIFSGIILHGLRISERDSDQEFLSARQAALRYQFRPLLSGRVVINEILLEEPRIRVVRLPDGTFNFSDLIDEHDNADAEDTALPAAPDSDTDEAPINLTIATVRLNRGQVIVIDTAVSPQAPLQYLISDLNMTARSITLEGAFPFEMSCRINDGSLGISGTADIARQTGSARIELQGLDATDFLPYFAADIPGTLTGLSVGLNAKAEGNLNQLTSSGSLTLSGIDLLLDDLPEAPIREAYLRADFDISADLKKSLLQIRQARINYNGIRADITGRIEQFDTEPNLALDLTLDALKLSTALDALPDELVADAHDLEPDGSLDIKARIEGPANSPDLLKSAEVRINAVRATLGPMQPEFNGKLLLSGDRLVSSDMVMNAAGNRASIDLTADNLFDEPIRADVHINAEHFDIDALLKEAPAQTPAPGKQTAHSPAKAETPAEEIGPFDLPLLIEGTVKIARAVYAGLRIDDFDLAFGLADNILTLQKMSGRAADGTFMNSARIDLGRAGLAYTTKIKLQGMQADTFVSACAPQAAGTFFGTLNLDIDADGSGTLPDTVKQNLNATMRVNLADGRITGAGLARGLADFLNLDELRELRFRTYTGTANIKQGRARIDTELLGTDVRMQPRGTISLDGTLDLILNAGLSPALMQKIDRRGQFAALMSDRQGWGQVPITVKGSFEKPRFSLDTSGLMRQVEERALDALQQRLFDRTPAPETKKDTKAPEQQPAPPATPDAQSEQPERSPDDERKSRQDERRQILDDTLRGIFER